MAGVDRAQIPSNDSETVPDQPPALCQVQLVEIGNLQKRTQLGSFGNSVVNRCNRTVPVLFFGLGDVRHSGQDSLQIRAKSFGEGRDRLVSQPVPDESA